MDRRRPETFDPHVRIWQEKIERLELGPEDENSAFWELLCRGTHSHHYEVGEEFPLNQDQKKPSPTKKAS